MSADGGPACNPSDAMAHTSVTNISRTPAVKCRTRPIPSMADSGYPADSVASATDGHVQHVGRGRPAITACQTAEIIKRWWSSVI